MKIKKKIEIRSSKTNNGKKKKLKKGKNERET